jgi:hypothetical protein
MPNTDNGVASGDFAASSTKAPVGYVSQVDAALSKAENIASSAASATAATAKNAGRTLLNKATAAAQAAKSEIQGAAGSLLGSEDQRGAKVDGKNSPMPELGEAEAVLAHSAADTVEALQREAREAKKNWQVRVLFAWVCWCGEAGQARRRTDLLPLSRMRPRRSAQPAVTLTFHLLPLSRMRQRRSAQPAATLTPHLLLHSHPVPHPVTSPLPPCPPKTTSTAAEGIGRNRVCCMGGAHGKPHCPAGPAGCRAAGGAGSGADPGTGLCRAVLPQPQVEGREE